MNDPANTFSVDFGGLPVAGIPATLPYTNFGPDTYTEYTVSGLLATGSSTDLTFNGTTADELDIDDVSVTPGSPTETPEPASLAGIGLGVLGLGAMMLKARKRSPSAA